VKQPPDDITARLDVVVDASSPEADGVEALADFLLSLICDTAEVTPPTETKPAPSPSKSSGAGFRYFPHGF
jgi:hypothetical protein